jgi:hypothetical protein
MNLIQINKGVFMKRKFTRYIILILIFSFLSVTLGNYWLSDDKTPVALVKKVVKNVTKKVSSESEWEIAKTGEPLYDGQEVRTGSKSLALVLFTDNSGILTVRENSIANIYGKKEERTIDKNTFIQRGAVGFEVKKQSEDEEFKFTTPTMVASIRGTAGLIQVEDLGINLNNNTREYKTTLIVEEGSIDVESTLGDKATESVSAGQSLTSDSGGQLVKGQSNQQQLNQLKKSKATTVKKIRFMINGEEYELEYFEKAE